MTGILPYCCPKEGTTDFTDRNTGWLSQDHKQKEKVTTENLVRRSHNQKEKRREDSEETRKPGKEIQRSSYSWFPGFLSCFSYFLYQTKSSQENKILHVCNSEKKEGLSCLCDPLCPLWFFLLFFGCGYVAL